MLFKFRVVYLILTIILLWLHADILNEDFYDELHASTEIVDFLIAIFTALGVLLFINWSVALLAGLNFINIKPKCYAFKQAFYLSNAVWMVANFAFAGWLWWGFHDVALKESALVYMATLLGPLQYYLPMLFSVWFALKVFYCVKAKFKHAHV